MAAEIPEDVLLEAERAVIECNGFTNSHSKREIIARAILAERERCAKVVVAVADEMAKGWEENPSKLKCGGSIAASNVGYFAEQAIRNPPQK